MRLSVVTILLCILLPSSLIQGADVRTVYIPGHVLVGWLIEYTKAESNAEDTSYYEVGKCWGFVAGVMDAHLTEKQIPDNLTVGEAIAAVRAYVNSHPERWNEPAIDLVVAALTLEATEAPPGDRVLVIEDSLNEPHPPHVHGHGHLLIALDGHALEMLFTAPAFDIAGFGHPPESKEEHRAVETSLDILSDPDKVFFFPAEAGCRAVSVEIENPWEPEKASEGHADVEVRYRLVCGDPKALTEIGVGFFHHFESIEQLSVQAVGPAGQTSDTLGPRDVRTDLTPIQ